MVMIVLTFHNKEKGQENLPRQPTSLIPWIISETCNRSPAR
jgi:hypothetical protein